MHILRSSHRLLIINRGHRDRSFTIWTAIIWGNACRTSGQCHRIQPTKFANIHTHTTPSLMGNHWPLSCICGRRIQQRRLRESTATVGGREGGRRAAEQADGRTEGGRPEHGTYFQPFFAQHSSPHRCFESYYAKNNVVRNACRPSERAFAIFNAAQTTTKCPLRYGHGCNAHEYAMRWHRVRSIIPLVFWIQGSSSRRRTLL